MRLYQLSYRNRLFAPRNKKLLTTPISDSLHPGPRSYWLHWYFIYQFEIWKCDGWINSKNEIWLKNKVEVFKKWVPWCVIHFEGGDSTWFYLNYNCILSQAFPLPIARIFLTAVFLSSAAMELIYFILLHPNFRSGNLVFLGIFYIRPIFYDNHSTFFFIVFSRSIKSNWSVPC